MENQKYIVNHGFSTHSGQQDSYEKSLNLQRTIKEYRDFAKPGSSTWGDYIIEIFHLLVYNTEKVSPKTFALYEFGNVATPIALIGWEQPSNNTVEISYDPNWGKELIPENSDTQTEWAILTDGFQFKIVHNNRTDIYFWANLEGILSEGRSDSFLKFYEVFSKFHKLYKTKPTEKLKTSRWENTSVSHIISSSNSILEKYALQFSNLRIGGDPSLWNEKTKFQAPHKQLLLLSVLDLFEQGNFRSGFVEMIPDLINQYNKYWSIIYPEKRIGIIVQPFFHLRTSNFWHLIPTVGNDNELEDKKEITSFALLKRLVIGAQLDPELVELLHTENHLETMRSVLLDRYFDQREHARLLNLSSAFRDYLETTKPFKTYSNQNNGQELVTGYIELSEFPGVPIQKTPSKADCEGYEYITMVQLCNIAQENQQSRSSACNAFGGDKGVIPVTPERQARVYGSRKFVLIDAVKGYFSEVGINWY